MTTMKGEIQVDPGHYEFSTYVTKARWTSFWHQLDELFALQPRAVLEVGVGNGVFAATVSRFGVPIKTMDFDPRLKPDIVGSVLEIPCEAQTFDVACAFQVLEHLPYEDFIPAVRELMRVSRKAVLLSLPDVKPGYPLSVHIPVLGLRRFVLPSPRGLLPAVVFGGEHYWELNTKGFPISRIIADLEAECWAVTRNFRVHENLFHRFLRIERRGV